MLVACAILSGVLTTLVLRGTTRAEALRAAFNRIYAHLLEFRLFFDEPWLIWRAQVSLMGDNLKLLRLLLPATLILSLPMVWLIVQLDRVYGSRALRPGEVAVVTAQLEAPLLDTDRVELTTSGDVAVDSQPVRIFRDQQVVWRVRARSLARPELQVRLNGRVVGRRSVTLEYPKASGTVPWLVWFGAVSAISGVMTTRILGVR
jgi:hypothetical protein